MQVDVRAALTAHAAPAAPFTLAGFDGSKISLADYRGKVVVVNYWHPSCSECREEAPFLQQSLRKFGSRQLAVLSVNVRASEDSYVLPLLHGNGYYFTPLHGGPSEKHDTPDSLLIDQDGRLVYRRGAIRDAADQRELELQIETLLSPASVRTDTQYR
jgi:thiol-disulfide isomerase/thioredoxin